MRILIFVSFVCQVVLAYEYDDFETCYLVNGCVGVHKNIRYCPYAIDSLRRGIYPEVVGFDGLDAVVCCPTVPDNIGIPFDPDYGVDPNPPIYTNVPNRPIYTNVPIQPDGVGVQKHPIYVNLPKPPDYSGVPSRPIYPNVPKDPNDTGVQNRPIYPNVPMDPNDTGLQNRPIYPNVPKEPDDSSVASRPDYTNIEDGLFDIRVPNRTAVPTRPDDADAPNPPSDTIVPNRPIYTNEPVESNSVNLTNSPIFVSLPKPPDYVPKEQDVAGVPNRTNDTVVPILPDDADTPNPPSDEILQNRPNNTNGLNDTVNENIPTDPDLIDEEDYADFTDSPKTISEQKCIDYYSYFGIFVFNGNISLAKEFPHMAVIGYEDDDGIQWGCGGALISEKFILTAAHCLNSARSGSAKYVRLGDLDLSTTTDDAKPQQINVKRAIPHPDYDPPSKYHDIGLIELESEVNRTEYVNIACLDTERQNEKSLTTAGWGKTEYAGQPSSFLLKANLMVHSHAECQKHYDSSAKSELPNGIVDDAMLCAGGESDTCQGDSGGPLFIKNEKIIKSEPIYNIVGVTSFGKPCGVGKIPGVYTRVYNYLRWIESIVWPE